MRGQKGGLWQSIDSRYIFADRGRGRELAAFLSLHPPDELN